jgi:hypothetical protein
MPSPIPQKRLSMEKVHRQFSKMADESTCTGRARVQDEIAFVVDDLGTTRGGVFFHYLIYDGEEWFSAERFGQIISCAENEQPLDLTWRRVCANHYHGNIRGHGIFL